MSEHHFDKYTCDTCTYKVICEDEPVALFNHCKNHDQWKPIAWFVEIEQIKNQRDKIAATIKLAVTMHETSRLPGSMLADAMVGVLREGTSDFPVEMKYQERLISEALNSQKSTIPDPVSGNGLHPVPRVNLRDLKHVAAEVPDRMAREVTFAKKHAYPHVNRDGNKCDGSRFYPIYKIVDASRSGEMDGAYYCPYCESYFNMQDNAEIDECRVSSHVHHWANYAEDLQKCDCGAFRDMECTPPVIFPSLVAFRARMYGIPEKMSS